MASRKQIVATVFHRFGLNAAGRRLLTACFSPYLRILNYHDVPPSQAQAFERQVARFAERYQPIGRAELLAQREGAWHSERPGMLLSFDDGLRSHADVVAPILERYGFAGCFLVPVGFVDANPHEQVEWAREHSIDVVDEYGDGRVALTWDDVRRLDEKHMIGCHTWDHVRLRRELSGPTLDREIVQARQRLERELGHEVDVFAWVGGEEWSYSAEAAHVIRQAGFRISMMTNNAVARPGCDLLQLQRTNIEAPFPDDLVELELSGFYDLLYLRKRQRVNRLTAARAA